MVPNTQYGASVRPRARRDGTVAFDVRYRLDGKSRTLSFEDDKSAEKWARNVRTIGPIEALKYLRSTDEDTAPTVNEYADTYIRGKSGVEGKTLDHYRMYMRLHIGPVFGELPLDAVQREMIASWINAQSDAGVAAKTIKNRHGFLSAMFQDAVDDDRIPLTRNPCAKTNLPESEQQEMVFLSADEFTTLLAYIPPKYQPIVYLLAATGLRWGEATALRPGDFDLVRGNVRVSRAWKSSTAKGWYIGPPKTKKSKRTISMPADLVDVVRPLVEAATEYVFTNAHGAPLRQSNFFNEVWEPARRLANALPPFDASKRDKSRAWVPRTGGIWDRKPAEKPLGKFARVHDLRHSHASWLLEAGVGLDVVQLRLGHESIKTTVEVYGHIAQERLTHAGDQIGFVLAGAMPQLTT
jgi:integrase